MGIFSKIKDAIFGKDEEKAPPASAPTPRNPTPVKPQPISDVDVEARLDAMDGADRLNWRTSIVDLMKLIGIDSSYENRKELAQELGNTEYSGSAEATSGCTSAPCRNSPHTEARYRPSSATSVRTLALQFI